MILIKIKGIEYNVRDLWADLTISDWIALSKIGLTEDTLHKPQTWDKVIAVFSDIPMEIIQKIPQADKRALYMNYGLRDFVAGLYDWKSIGWKAQGLQEVYFNGRKYYFPEYLQVGDKMIPAHKHNSKSVCEVSNLIQMFETNKEQGVKLLPLICATYLTEEPNEEYDMERISKRAKEFSELPLTYALEVFFCTVIYSSCSLIHSLSSLETGKGKRRATHFLIIIAGYSQWLKMRLWAVYQKLKNCLYGKC